MTKSLAISLLLSVSVLSVGCSGDLDHSAESAGREQEPPIVRLEPGVLEEFDIEIAVANAGSLEVVVSTPGEVVLNRDRLAHVVPRVSGVVQSVSKSVGDPVRAGEVLAVLDSRELSDIKAEYLANLERAELLRATFEREERLFNQGISSEQEYLEARQELAEIGIATRSARQKLLALGFDEASIADLPTQEEHDLVHFELTSPISGVVIERHVSQGESLASDAAAFMVADLSTVWVDLNIFQRDLDRVQEGMITRFSTTGGRLNGEARIDVIRPIVGEDTRTAIARIVHINSDGTWKPGLFVDARIVVNSRTAAVVVPPSAIAQMDGDSVLFVETVAGFVPRQVVLGDAGRDLIEVLEGLSPGDRYVSRGAFTLKAELEKGALDSDHSH